MAQGYLQPECIDYEEIFTSVVRFTSIRLLLVLAAVNDFHIRQIYAKIAFSHGSQNTDSYMKQKLGYASKKKADHACKLKTSIYGLKETSRC